MVNAGKDKDKDKVPRSVERMRPRVPYPNHTRHNVAISQGSISERAKRDNVSESFVYRLDRRIKADGGDWRRRASSKLKGRPRKLTQREAGLLMWQKCISRTVSLADAQKALKLATGTTASKSTVSREWKRLGLTKKRVERISYTRDESDRIAFWSKGPLDVMRPGVCGVSHSLIVDVDETGFYTTNANKTTGHWFQGVPAKQKGRPKREGKRLTVCAAVDSREGVVLRLCYEGGTSKEKFHVFMNALLLKLGNTRRIIMMDNLNSHLSKHVKDLVHQAGHILIFRPTSSPDFGPVEWSFAYIDKFLQAHDSSVTKFNLEQAVKAAFDSVTAESVAGYFAQAHFFVQGHVFTPYMGQQ